MNDGFKKPFIATSFCYIDMFIGEISAIASGFKVLYILLALLLVSFCGYTFR